MDAFKELEISTDGYFTGFIKDKQRPFSYGLLNKNRNFCLEVLFIRKNRFIGYKKGNDYTRVVYKDNKNRNESKKGIRNRGTKKSPILENPGTRYDP